MIERPQEVWHRRPHESTKGYRAFTAYLALDADRSVTRVAQKLSVSRTLVSRWSSQYDWAIRAKEYDEHVSELRLARLASSRRNLVDAQVKLAEKMFSLVESSIVNLMKRRKLNAQDLTRMFIAASRSVQAVFGDDQPLSVEKPRIVVLSVQRNVPRHFSREEAEATVQ